VRLVGSRLLGLMVETGQTRPIIEIGQAWSKVETSWVDGRDERMVEMSKPLSTVETS